MKYVHIFRCFGVSLSLLFKQKSRNYMLKIPYLYFFFSIQITCNWLDLSRLSEFCRLRGQTDKAAEFSPDDPGSIRFDSLWQNFVSYSN